MSSTSKSWALIALAACGGSSSPGTNGSSHGSSLASGSGSADAVAGVPCAGESVPELDAATLGAWKASGHTMSKPGGAAVIGIVADAGGADPTTLAALGRLRGKLDGEHVDAVISLGGMGKTEPEIEAVLAALATGAPWPLVAIPGDLEPAAAHEQAVQALVAKKALVVDGRRVRYLDAGEAATLGTIPGVGSSLRSPAGADGCMWSPADVEAVVGTLTDKPGLRVLVTAEAPRGSAGGDATGELGLAPGKPVDLLVHGAADEASPAASGKRDGGGISLSPGAADATGRLSGPRIPTAGVLTLKDGAWTWKVLADR